MSDTRKRQFSAAGIVAIFVAVFVIGIIRQPETPKAEFAAESTKVSSASNRFYYVKDWAEAYSTGEILQVYSAYTNGMDERQEETYAANEWQSVAQTKGGYESMNTLYGDAVSPDEQSTILFLPKRPFMPFAKGTRVLIQTNGQRYELPLHATEFEWLPDSTRLLFVSDSEIFVLDVATRQYAKVADGIGMIAIQ